MREVKFRGMGIDGGWNYGLLTVLNRNYMRIEKGHYISNSTGLPFAYHVRPETVGQYTGLKDSLEKEIYDGDIVSARNRSDMARFTGYVHFENGQYWVNYIGYESYYLPLMLIVNAQYEPIKVLGNRFEHPHLLEGRDEA